MGKDKVNLQAKRQCKFGKTKAGKCRKRPKK